MSRTQRQTATLKRATWIWALFGLMIALYAVLAWDAAEHVLPGNYDPQTPQMIRDIESKVGDGAPVAEVSEEAAKAYPAWINLTAKVAGSQYAFGANGNAEAQLYYGSMAPGEKRVLSLHMALGGACIILGILQFWPGFRRKYRKAHRYIGGGYIIACYTMVAASIYHLLHTGIENTYQGFAFNIQLWFLAISTPIAQTASIYFLKKRNFALHLGLQVYTFTAFLNAPVQRYDWAVFGAIYPHLSQGEVNTLVDLLTFWQCLIVGALIFAWNRATSPARSAPAKLRPHSVGFRTIVTGASLSAFLTIATMYLVWPGLGSWEFVRAIVPASTLAADVALHKGRMLQNVAFTLALCTALASGVWLLMRDADTATLRKIFYVAAVIAGAIQIMWGIELGEPKMAVTSGGGFYLVAGISVAGFALLASFLEARGHEGLWREAMVFAVSFTFAPALLLWGLGLWHAMGVIPQQYVDVGHGYILAAGGAILGPTLTGFFAMFTSSETRSRMIS